MNKIILSLIIVLSLAFVGCKPTTAKKEVKAMEHTGKLAWYSMSDAEALVKNDKKKILVDVYTKWCGPCKMMDRMTFTDESVQQLLTEKFHTIKFDAEGPDNITFQGKTWANPKYMPNRRGRNAKHELANLFQVRGYPSLVIMDENFNIIEKIVGFKKPDQLKAALAKY